MSFLMANETVSDCTWVGAPSTGEGRFLVSVGPAEPSGMQKAQMTWDDGRIGRHGWVKEKGRLRLAPRTPFGIEVEGELEMP